MPILVQRVGRERIYSEAVESHIGGWFWNAATRARLNPVGPARVRVQPADVRHGGLALLRDGRGAPEAGAGRLDAARGAEARGDRARGGGRRPSSRRCSAPSPSSCPSKAAPRRRETRSSSTSVRRTDPRSATTSSSSARNGWSRSSTTASAACSAGESREVAYELADGAHRAAPPSRSSRSTERVLPPLDDELAQAASEFDTYRGAAHRDRGSPSRADRRRARGCLPRRGDRRARQGVERRSLRGRSSSSARASCSPGLRAACRRAASTPTPTCS